jgi:HAD superfamily hydrolase (TIGR01490 family)
VKKFAVFDIDGTLFRWQLFHEVVFELIKSGHLPAQVRHDIEETLQQWRARKHSGSFHDYEMALVKAFLPHVPTIKVSALEDAADTVIKRCSTHVYMYTRSLIESLKKEGYTLIAISGSQNEIVQRFAKLWHFDLAVGQIFETKDGYYTGAIPGSKLLVDQKDTILKQLVKEHGLSWEGSVAVGDSLSDAATLKLVEQPVAFNPNDLLFTLAKEKGWKVVIERKNMIYELEPQNGVYLLANASTR